MPLWARGVALVSIALLGCSSQDPPPNVLLVTLDTTRADRLGVYGHPGGTSPRIDELAREASVYERAYSTSSWTLPAHASLFTGEFPSSHGAHLDPEGPLNLRDSVGGMRPLAELRVRGLAEAKRTLAEILRDAGYATAGVVSGPWLTRLFGLAQGFDRWEDSDAASLQGADAGTVSDRALAWLEAQPRSPFFLFLNYFDPHLPHTPPEAFAARFPESSYDAEIAYADAELGRVFDWLRDRGLWDRTLVVVTSDHGELLGEHGIHGHNRYLFEPLIRVPLIVKPPGGAPAARVTRPVQITEVPGLVLESTGLAAPPQKTGPIYAEVYPLDVQRHTGQWRAWLDGDLKFLWNSRGDHRLHDLAADPGELRNLASLEPERAEAMAAALERFRTRLPPPPRGDPGEVDAETRRALDALGYLE